MACCLLVASLFRSLRTRMIAKGRPSFNDLVIENERRRARAAAARR